MLKATSYHKTPQCIITTDEVARCLSSGNYQTASGDRAPDVCRVAAAGENVRPPDYTDYLTLTAITKAHHVQATKGNPPAGTAHQETSLASIQTGPLYPRGDSRPSRVTSRERCR
jgi:hypothetical protein